MRRYNCRRLTVEEQDALAVRAKAGDLEARNRLVESVMPTIASQARRISRPGEDVDDYAQEAALKIIENVVRYEPRKGHFLAFVLPWSAGARHIWQHKQGWQRASAQRLSFASIDAPVSDDNGKSATLANFIPDERDDSLERESTRLAVRESIRLTDLTPQERRVVSIGIELGMESGFQTRCAEMMCLSRERISQLWNGAGRKVGAVAKLRRSLAWLEREAA